MEAEQHQAALKTLQLAHAGQRRATERVQEWEEQQAMDRQRELLRADQLNDASSQVQVEQVRQELEALRRSGARADALAQHEKLLRTIEADAVHSRQVERIALDAEQQRHQLRQQEREAAWKHELAQVRAISESSDTAKVMMAESANAQVLVDYLKTQLYQGMRADQLSALAGVAAASNNGGGQDALVAPVRHCSNGHQAGPADQFCATCGTALS
jgi:hypothetical protein